MEMEKKDVQPLNTPVDVLEALEARLESDGIELMEEKIEMGSTARSLCKWWNYGRC